MKQAHLHFKLLKPIPALSDLVESFWMLENTLKTSKDIIILPDGRVDLFFSQSEKEPFHITLSGLETQPDQAVLAGKTIMFAISFKLPAIEYIFANTVAPLINNARHLPADFWNFSASDLWDFDAFCNKASQKVQSFLPAAIDGRKQKLFKLLYTTKGGMSVTELSQQTFWSARQINRYFNQQFGLSLKAYCNILRFRASFPDIRDGKLFPRENFADQSHFIKEVKKLSGASPKQLNQNQNDRFIQFSLLPPE